MDRATAGDEAPGPVLRRGAAVIRRRGRLPRQAPAADVELRDGSGAAPELVDDAQDPDGTSLAELASLPPPTPAPRVADVSAGKPALQAAETADDRDDADVDGSDIDVRDGAKAGADRAEPKASAAGDRLEIVADGGLSVEIRPSRGRRRPGRRSGAPADAPPLVDSLPDLADAAEAEAGTDSAEAKGADAVEDAAKGGLKDATQDAAEGQRPTRARAARGATPPGGISTKRGRRTRVAEPVHPVAGAHVALVGMDAPGPDPVSGQVLTDLRGHLAAICGRLTLLGGRGRFGGVVGHRISGRPDVVVGVIPSRGGAMAAAGLADRYQAPLVVVVADSDWRRTGALRGLTERLELGALRRAVRVVVAQATQSQETVAELVAAGVAADRILTLPALQEETEGDGAVHADPDAAADGGSDGGGDASAGPDDAAAARPGAASEDRKAARQRLGWDESAFIVVHAGEQGYAQDLPNVVRCARELDRRGSEVCIVLIGDGGRRRSVQLATEGLTNLVLENSFDRADLQRAVIAADLLLVNERAGLHGVPAPGILSCYLGAGRPIVAAVGSGGATARALQRASGVSCLVDPGKPWELADAIELLRGSEGRLAQMAAAGRRHARVLHVTGSGPADLLDEALVAALNQPR